MSDQGTYINTYLDHSVGMIHEYIGMVLQLRTELKLANDLVSQKNGVISALQAELESDRSDKNELNHKEQNIRNLEGELSALRNKVGHMDTLTNQFNDIKRDFIEKDKELENVKKELSDAKTKLKELLKGEKQAKKEEKKSLVVTPKKVINKETTSLSMNKPEVVEDKNIVEENDDF